ncbi:radical SAM family heme chaperone HemW [Kistimonas asteriae]|uniref:radical SAM family heme chaperone HemW n=1 Tax=Kistimonas asteriae TaxID=517724 RepID=UPI001BA52513|nr:radical SAM family heme chaperone HemW [Kistimonas asteriae]
MLTLPPLSLYVHVPWCIQKCPYCDFNSHTAKGELPERDYVNALLQDFETSLDAIQGRTLHSIFIGGGTPSLLSPSAYERLFAGLRQHIDFSDEIEITLEANPGTFEQDKFTGFRQTGINRLSIGIQSFQDDKLKKLGRIHHGEEAQRAVEMAFTAGFTNINLDLMHGLPNQSQDDALFDLTTAIALKPTHLSWYQLTIEPNTVFYSRPPVLPEDDALWDIQEAGQALLAESGYQQYEISAYSQPGRQSRHNLNYWQFGDYIGIGAGAHGKLTLLEEDAILRNWKTRFPADYLNPAKPFEAGHRTLVEEDLPLEFMMNALRLNQGVEARYFSQRTGLMLEKISNTLKQADGLGFITLRNNKIAPTTQGSLFLNEVLELF